MTPEIEQAYEIGIKAGLLMALEVMPKDIPEIYGVMELLKTRASIEGLITKGEK